MPNKVNAMKQVKNILMVCLGNICRSPVAEGVMRAKLLKYNLPIHVDSAGTANYHVGENPDPRSIANATKNGIDISKLKARQFHVKDFESFDIIYVMDENNLNTLMAMAPGKLYQQKVRLILQEHADSKYKIVPDPYYGIEKDFQLVFDLLDEVCEQIASNLQQLIIKEKH
jgi:protein-tyrosine phosphatase